MVSVYLYIANLIDYLRFVFLIISFYFSFSDPKLFIICYFISFSLDFFDGLAARHFNQCSRLGSCLDMVVDRLSTMGLLYILGSLYPDYKFIFLSLIILDIGSHWLQTFSSLLYMAHNKDKKIVNHKELKEIFYLLDVYYKNKIVLGICCLGAELFLLCLYANYFNKDLLSNSPYMIFFYANMIIYAYKQFMSVLQIGGACDRIVKIDEVERQK